MSKVTLEGLTINDVAFIYGVSLEEYVTILGIPARSHSPGPPAPYGHQNNVIHLYDSLGLVLNEHHSTHVISEVRFLLETQTATFPTATPYLGELCVCGVKIQARLTFEEFTKQCEVAFTPSLRSAAFAKSKNVSIHLTLVAPSRKRGTRKSVISEVAVGFKGSNWLSVVK